MSVAAVRKKDSEMAEEGDFVVNDHEEFFVEGERVLCFEPDPTKVKVIYDAKIIKISEDVDDPNYLVHFQGWNSSWDRYVPKSFLLKDTPGNRQIQRQLVLETEDFKRRKKKKKRKLSPDIVISSSAAASAASAIVSPPPPSSSTTATTTTTTTTDGKTKKKKRVSEEEVNENIVVPVTIPNKLKKTLENDQINVLKNKKLARIPASPNIVTVLENFVFHFASSRLLALEKSLLAKRHSVGQKLTLADLNSVQDSINVCKEVVEGLRICIDFYLENCLLYDPEKHSKEVVEPIIPQQRPKILEQNSSLSSSSASPSSSGRSTPITTGGGGSLPSTNSAIKILNALNDWRLVPESLYRKIPLAASLVYGPIYLLRLFVKIPEILGKMKIPPKTMKILIKYNHSLLDYLNQHPEYFSDKLYE